MAATSREEANVLEELQTESELLVQIYCPIQSNTILIHKAFNNQAICSLHSLFVLHDSNQGSLGISLSQTV